MTGIRYHSLTIPNVLLKQRVALAALFSILLPTAATVPTVLAQGVPTLTLTREIKIDGMTEDLVDIGWVRVASNGRVALSQQQDKLVRFFDANGKAIGKFGRAGDGPGEFRNLRQAGWFGDSLWVHDGNAARVTVIPPSLGEPRIQTSIGAFIRSANPALPVLTAASIVGISTSDNMMLSGLLFPDSIIRVLPPYARDLKAAFVRAESSAGFVAFLGGLRNQPNTSVRIRQGMEVPIPFVERNVTGGAHNGSRAIIVQPSVDGRDAGTFSVTAIGLRGDTIFSRRHPFALERIPAAAFNAAVEERIKGYTTPAKNTQAVACTDKACPAPGVATLPPFNAAAYRAGAKSPAAYAPFNAVIVGRDGSIWLRGRTKPSERTYLVLDPRGELYGQFILKADIKLAEADLNNIWTVEPDADGVESVVRYRLTKTR